MRTLRIGDVTTDGYLAFDLRELLDLLGIRAKMSRWVCTVEECIAAEPLSLLEQYNRPEGIDGEHLTRLAAATQQIVDGLLAGFDAGEAQPWVRLAAIDSSYWEVTAAEEVLISFTRVFRDTKIIAPDHLS